MLKKLLTLAVMLFTTAAFAVVDINTASEAELDGIKGIGPGLSGKILTERKTREFKDWNDFIGRVSGVGHRSAARFSKEGLTVGGQKYSAATATKAETHDKKPDTSTEVPKSAAAKMPTVAAAPAASTAEAPAAAGAASAGKK